MLISDRLEFEYSKSCVKSVIFDGVEFPNQVFKSNFKRFSFEVFDFVFTEEFWNRLKHMANLSNDDTLLIAVLSPFEANEFKIELGSYNWIKLSFKNSFAEYIDSLNCYPENGVWMNSVVGSAERILWLPYSGKWAVLGERSNDVCILSLQNEMPENLFWNTAEWAIEEGMKNNFMNQVVPPWISSKIMRNYGAE